MPARQAVRAIAPSLRGRDRTHVHLLLAAGAAGSGLALQARLNGELAVAIDAPLMAVVVNFLVGLGTLVLVVPAVRRRTGTDRARRGSWAAARGRSRWWYWTGGLGAAVVVTAAVTATPRLGVALVTVGVAAGLAVAGLVADRVGLGPAGRHLIGAYRLVGALMAVVAVAVSHAPSVATGLEDGHYVAFVVVGGMAMGFQQPINGRLADALGDAGRAAAVSFAVGTVAVVTVAAGAGAVVGVRDLAWPTNPGLYVGGALAAVYILVATTTVRRLGALRLALATLAGQLVGATVLDLVVPIEGEGLTAARFAGVVLALLGLAVSSRPARGRTSA